MQIRALEMKKLEHKINLSFLLIEKAGLALITEITSIGCSTI
jgi:hypothetical protein